MDQQKSLPSLNFIDEGKGNITLVFLHYFGGSAHSWSFVTDELKKDFRCVAIDLCGFGDSPTPLKELSIKDSTDAVSNLVQNLLLENYVLIGHSMGGKIALSIAANKPGHLRAVVLVAPSPPTPEPMTAGARKELLDTFGKAAAIEKLIKKIIVQPLTKNVFEDTVADHLRVTQVAWDSWIKKGSREDISSQMTNIALPIIVISSPSDPNFPTSFLKKEFVRYFPDAVFNEITDTGHLIPIEAPLLVVKFIKRFAAAGI